MLNPFPRDTPVAVMGTTVEFVDLLIEMNFSQIDIIDSNKDFHDEARARSIFVGQFSANFVHQTWQEYFGNTRNKYGAILSDLTLGNIPYDQRANLYLNLERTLTVGGVYIDKVLTNEARRLTVVDISNEFQYAPINLEQVNRFNCRAVFCSELAGATVNADSIYSQLSTAFAYSPRLMKFVSECSIITPEGMEWYYGKSWDVVSQNYIQSLKPLAKIPQESNSPYFGHAHQFIFTKSEG